MKYIINEGQLILPELPEDDSANILKFRQLQASLVITRAVLKEGQTLESYIDNQFALSKKSMKNFIVEARKTVPFGSDEETTAYETECQFEQKGHRLYQRLLMTANQQQLMVFTYSQTRPFSPNDMQHWQAIKDSFVPHSGINSQ